MKEEKEQISAVGNALTMMIELIIIRMLQPMKDMISELKSDVESIKEWCVEELSSMVGKISDMKSDVELSINEAISSIDFPSLEDIEDKMQELEYKIDEVEDSRVDNESKIEDIEFNVEEIVSKLGLIGDILND